MESKEGEPPALFRLSCLAAEAIFRRLLRVRVEGLHLLPRNGAAIVAMNHASYLDPLIIGAPLGLIRPFRSIGKKELFDIPLLGAYLKAMGSIPLDRDQADPAAMRAALEALRRGSLFLMAPEGTRGKSGRKRSPKPGVAFLAHRSGAPIVPVRVAGLDGWPMPGRVWVRFGRPMRFEPGTDDPRELRRLYREFSERVMRVIYDMQEPAAGRSDA